MSIDKSRKFTEYELFLIQDYAQDRWHQMKNSNTCHANGHNYSRFPQVNVIGNNFSTNNSTRKNDKNKNKMSFTTMFVISALFYSVIYMLTTLPRAWGVAKQYYFTRQITKLTSKKTDNNDEKYIIENLKKLIKADKSKDFIRDQKVNACSAMGIFASGAAYLTTVKNDYAEWIPEIINKKFPTRVPFVSDSLNEKIISLLTNENLIKFSKVSAAISIGALTLNTAYKLYQDFFYQTKHPKSQLIRSSTNIMCTINHLIDSPASAHAKNIGIRTASAFGF